jgi:proline dehydrogenase
VSGVLRAVLLRAGRGARVRTRLERRAFLERAARRFVPGDTIDDALGAAVDLQVLGIAAVYTYLGGPVVAAVGAGEVVDHYLDLLRRIGSSEGEGEISVSLSQLGVDVDEDAGFARLVALAAAAGAQGSYLWIEAEDGARVDRTLDVYQRLRASQPRTGVCLQAGLRRTAKDVERLLPISPAIRLVKGGDDEPAAVAFQARREVDANYLGIAVTLLRESRTRPLRVALATNDTALVAQIASHAAAAGIARDAFEVQMLFGIRAREARGLARSGYRVRTLIPYGPAWYPWYLRRLAERPANALGALRQLGR